MMSQSVSRKRNHDEFISPSTSGKKAKKPLLLPRRVLVAERKMDQLCKAFSRGMRLSPVSASSIAGASTGAGAGASARELTPFNYRDHCIDGHYERQFPLDRDLVGPLTGIYNNIIYSLHYYPVLNSMFTQCALRSARELPRSVTAWINFIENTHHNFFIQLTPEKHYEYKHMGIESLTLYMTHRYHQTRTGQWCLYITFNANTVFDMLVHLGFLEQSSCHSDRYRFSNICRGTWQRVLSQVDWKYFKSVLTDGKKCDPEMYSIGGTVEMFPCS